MRYRILLRSSFASNTCVRILIDRSTQINIFESLIWIWQWIFGFLVIDSLSSYNNQLQKTFDTSVTLSIDHHLEFFWFCRLIYVKNICIAFQISWKKRKAHFLKEESFVLIHRIQSISKLNVARIHATIAMALIERAAKRHFWSLHNDSNIHIKHLQVIIKR